MSPEPLRHGLLSSLGVDHGFGVRGSRAPPGLVRPRQVHGSAVAIARPRGSAQGAEADAIASDVAGTAVGIVTADCVPILLCAESGGAVAAVHAGWRGLGRGVVEAGVAALRELAGGDGRLRAVLGPHIGPCCYEVDAPVLRALEPRFGDALERSAQPVRSGHAMLDLGSLVRSELDRLGVAADAVAGIEGACTHCDAERFYSYRRDGPQSGRLVHHIIASPAKAGPRKASPKGAQ